MGLLQRALRHPDTEQRDFGSSDIPGPLDGYRTNAGPVVNEDTALAHIDVYKCVSLIADTIGTIPFRSHRNQAYTDSEGRPRTFAQKLPRQPLLLTDPMPGDLASEFGFKHRVVSSLLMDGNAYIELNARNGAVPTVATPIHPSQVRKVSLDERGRKVYEMHDGGILGDVRDGGTVAHLTGFLRAGALIGISPIKAGMQGIALSMAAEGYGSNWFGSPGPVGFLHTEGDPGADDAKKLKREWMQTYSGLNREPAFLYGGLSWTPIQVPPEESQFIETRKFQTSQIASLYRIAPHLVGDVEKSTSWGTGIEEQNLGFVGYTLTPWIARLEQALSFLMPNGQFVKGNVNALLRARLNDRYTAYSIGRQWGWLSVNDVRELEDMPPIDGGDTYLQPMNMVDSAMANAPEEPDAPEAGPEVDPDLERIQETARVLQQTYLAKGVLATDEELRALASGVGAIDLPGGLPEDDEPEEGVDDDETPFA